MKKNEQPAQVLDFLMPDTTTTEAEVLAGIINEPLAFREVEDVLNPTLFSDPDFRSVWETIVHLNNEDGDLLQVKLLEKIGGEKAQRIFSVGNDGLSISPIETRERSLALRNGAAKRRTFIAVSNILQLTRQPGVTEQEILAAKEAFDREVEGAAPMQTEKHISTIFQKMKEQNAKAAQAAAEGKTLRISTGFYGLNTILNGGFAPGQLIILAARPSVGKTALMLQLARAAAEEGNATQIYSLEMTDLELGARTAFATGLVRPVHLVRGQVTDETFERLQLEVGELPIYVNDHSRTLDDILSRLSQSVRKGRCNIAFIDYLGLIADTYNTGNGKLYQVIGKITGTFKAAAKRLGIPIVLLCQLNREQAREGRSPELYDLRDSGSIEQDADVVLMLESNFKMKDGTQFPLVAWLRKNRAGKKDWGFPFEPNDTYSAFRELEPIVANKDVPPLPPAPIDLPPNVNGLDDDLPQEQELPF